jgi:hypothetical protein
VKLAILRDKIYFEFGIEDEDIFYLLDIHRQKYRYQDKNKGFNEKLEVREYFLEAAKTRWEDF